MTSAGDAILVSADNDKVQPSNIAADVRFYTDLDAIAANGLGDGGAIDIRENVTRQSSSTARSASSRYR